MNKYEEALKDIYESYDAFYISNKYGDGTHKDCFDLLLSITTNAEYYHNAINWIRNEYDCYYSKRYIDNNGLYLDGTPFKYISDIVKDWSDK
jgi:hypothetical protein